MADEKKRMKSEGQQPEALAQFAKSARRDDPRPPKNGLVADSETSPIPADNAEKHSVAEELLNEGAHGEQPDPESAGVNELPDRILDKQPKKTMTGRP